MTKNSLRQKTLIQHEREVERERGKERERERERDRRCFEAIVWFVYGQTQVKHELTLKISTVEVAVCTKSKICAL
jgi:hypothetical protein